MTLDFQQVRKQVHELGENAAGQEALLRKLRQDAYSELEQRAYDVQQLRLRVQRVVQQFDPSLRCALPWHEPLNTRCPSPLPPKEMTVIAADGSQITPDRHAEVLYGVINVGAIQMCYGSPLPPAPVIDCKLLYGDEINTGSGAIPDDLLSLKRDLNERALLADLAASCEKPVITLTDGPLELWGAKDAGGEDGSEFRKSLKIYQEALTRLAGLKAATAGYVDKPGADLVVRLLEVALASEGDLPEIKKFHPLRGVSDRFLFAQLLEPGERSAVFAMQSQSARLYQGDLALHFFYLNVGRLEKPWITRVEIPAWVVENPDMINPLHAVLMHQCRVLGGRPYPYLLHRAHETAVVSLEEKQQVTQMILQEMFRRGIPIDQQSNKQGIKDLQGRTRMKP